MYSFALSFKIQSPRSSEDKIMRFRYCGPKLLCAFLLLLLTSALSFAQTENSAAIDCSGATSGAFTSVQQAILNSPDHTTFTLSGNCTETVINIQHRNDLSFIALAPSTIQVTSPDQPVVIITHSRKYHLCRDQSRSPGARAFSSAIPMDSCLAG